MNRIARNFLYSTMLCTVTLISPAAYAQSADANNQTWQYASAGDAGAQAKLGYLYSKGLGVSRSDEEAYHWFSRAAQQGHAESQLMLSGYLATGKGTAKDLVSAYQWAYLAAANAKNEEAYQSAAKMMNALVPGMTARQVTEAERRAAAWRPAVEEAREPARPAAGQSYATQPRQASVPARSEPPQRRAPHQATTQLASAEGYEPGEASEPETATDRAPTRSRFHGYRHHYGESTVIVIRPQLARAFRHWRRIAWHFR